MAKGGTGLPHGAGDAAIVAASAQAEYACDPMRIAIGGMPFGPTAAGSEGRQAAGAGEEPDARGASSPLVRAAKRSQRAFWMFQKTNAQTGGHPNVAVS